MVVFTCNHCGESLQKPRVEKHYGTQCRRPKSLTCVDCFKDFKNEEYVVHTKCITEEERYAAKGSIPGGIVKKGDVKQESWTDMIRSIVQTENNLKPSLRDLFNTISTYSNVPRKKTKFINFLKSSTGGRVNFTDIESAWDLIEKYKNEQSKNNNHTQNGQNVNGEVKENGTKHKLEDSEEAPAKKKKKNKPEVGDECNKLEDNAEVSAKKKKKNKPEVGDECNKLEDSVEVSAKKKKKNKQEVGDECNKLENSEEVSAKKKKKNKQEVNDECNEEVSGKKNEKAKDELKIDSGDGEDVSLKKKKKVKDESEVQTPAENGSKIFSFKGTILNILNSKGSISSTKLQKKVLSAYLKETGNTEYTEKTIKKYNQKLKKLSNVIIKDDVVSLITNSVE